MHLGFRGIRFETAIPAVEVHQLPMKPRSEHRQTVVYPDRHPEDGKMVPLVQCPADFEIQNSTWLSRFPSFGMTAPSSPSPMMRLDAIFLETAGCWPQGSCDDWEFF